MKAFAIVEFSAENSIEVVPSSWVSEDDTGLISCLYPSDLTKAAGYARKGQSPCHTWPTYEIHILGSADDYIAAVEKAKLAIEAGVSNVDTDPDVPRKRKSVEQNMYHQDSSDNHDIDVEPLNLPQSSPPLSSPLQPFPFPAAPLYSRNRPTTSSIPSLQPRNTQFRQAFSLSSIYTPQPGQAHSSSTFHSIQPSQVHSSSTFHSIQPSQAHSLSTIHSIPPSPSQYVTEATSPQPRPSQSYYSSSSPQPSFFDTGSSHQQQHRQAYTASYAEDDISTPVSIMLSNIQRRVDSIHSQQAMIVEILKGHSRMLNARVLQPDDDIVFTISTTKIQFQELCNRLHDEEVFRKMVVYLKRTSVRRGSDTIHRMMDKIGSIELWCGFCYKGRTSTKTKFYNTTVCNAVTTASMLCHEELAADAVDTIIGDYLKHCPGNLRRIQIREEEAMADSVECHNDDDEGSTVY